MSDLLVIVPSRGRPGSADRLVEALQGTLRAHLLLVIDEDDPFREEYFTLEGEYSILTAPRGRPGIVDPLNWALGAYPLPKYVGFLGDDHLPHGKTWDQEICQALGALGTGIVYGNDLLQGENLATAAFMTSGIVDTLGYMAPPELQHLFVDDYWMAIGRGMGRLTYLPDTIVEHLHPLNGKAEWDETYQGCNDQDTVARPDRLAFELMGRNGRLAEDIAKLRAILS